MQMTLPEWANVATIIGVLSIPLSAFFIWLQLRQQTLLAKVANTQSLVELSSPFNLQLIQDPKMAEYWVHGAEQYQSFDPVEQYRYKSLLIWWLILHENIFFQWKSGLLDKTIYESWQYDLEKFALYQLRERWTELKPAFQSDFVRHVEGLIGKAEPDRASSRRGEHQMKQNVMLTIASLLSILLLTFHLTDDIARGMEPG